MSIKSISILYISETAQDYEKPWNTCLIISRRYSFKEVEGFVPRRGSPMRIPTRKFQMGPLIYCNISYKKKKIFGAKRKLIYCPVQKLFRVKVRKKPIFTPWYASKIFYFYVLSNDILHEKFHLKFLSWDSLRALFWGDNFSNPLKKSSSSKWSNTNFVIFHNFKPFPKYRGWVYRLYRHHVYACTYCRRYI